MFVLVVSNSINPIFFFKPSQSAVGFELWSISNNILFDNLLITDDENVAKNFAAQSFDLKQDKITVDAVSIFPQKLKNLQINTINFKVLYKNYHLHE